MKNEASWAATKFEPTKRRWRGSRDSRYLAVTSRITSDAAVRYYETYLKEYSSGHLLDLGCGTAPLYGIYRPLVRDITCVDWAGSPHDKSFADLEVDLNGPNSLPDASFDTILTTSVVEHIAAPEVFWDEIARVLRPGGVLILSTPFMYPLHEEPHDYHRYTEHQLRAQCESRCLTVLKLETFGGRAEVICDLLVKAFPRPRFLSRALVWVLQFFLVRTWKYRRNKPSTRRFPLGYVLAARKGVV